LQTDDAASSFEQAKMSNSKRMNGIRLLIVNDNGELRSSVADYLETQNIYIGSLEPLEGSLVKIEAFAPGVVLLYHSLLRADGFGLLRAIRACSDVPVIMIAATGTDEADRIVSFELGADDCLTAPFSARELLARVKAVIRRNTIRCDEPRRGLDAIVYGFSGWQLHEHPQQLIDPRGSKIPLSRLECALLTAFVRAPGRILTREHLLSATQASSDVFDRTIDLGVYKLRRKLGGDVFASSIIATERGRGYRFCASVERVAFKVKSDRRNKHDPSRC
jgi:DNA-binding response OmpR family regulator